MKCQCGTYQHMSVGEGLAMQNDDLRKWVERLKPHYSVCLLQKVIELNNAKPVRCGHDVVRGSQIDEVVLNMNLPL